MKTKIWIKKRNNRIKKKSVEQNYAQFCDDWELFQHAIFIVLENRLEPHSFYFYIRKLLYNNSSNKTMHNIND